VTRLGRTIDELDELSLGSISDASLLAMRDMSLPKTHPNATKYFSVAALKSLIAAIGDSALRKGTVSLTANTPTSVVFSQPFTNPYFLAVKRGEDSAGSQIGCVVSEEGQGGFTVTAMEDCTFYYLAVQNIVGIDLEDIISPVDITDVQDDDILRYDASEGVWKNVQLESGDANDPGDIFFIRDDFAIGNATSGNVGELRWSWATSIGGNAVRLIDEIGAIGLFQLQTGAQLASNIRLYSLGTGLTLKFIPTQPNQTLKWRIKLGQASGALFNAYIGLAQDYDTPTGGGKDFVGFQYSANNANWLCVCTTSFSGTEHTNSGVPVSTDWVTLEIRTNSDATAYQFYINGNLVVTRTTDLPSATSCSPLVWLGNTETAGKTLTVDYFYYKITGLTR